MIKIKTLLFGLIIISFASCNRNPLKVKISDIDQDIEFVDFSEGLFRIGQTDTISEIAELSNAYPDFLNLFTYRIIRVGGIQDDFFPEAIMQFVTDTMILNVKSLVEEEFYDIDKIQNKINTAFKYYQYHFPGKKLPTVYTYVSGFNQSVVTAEDIIGISLDKYLGRDCEYYKKLRTSPRYKVLNMHKDKIPSDVVYAWGMSEYDESNVATNLMGNIIHHGKLMYFVDAMLPEMHDSLKIGYTTDQLRFCENNEAQMWNYLIEKKMLFSNNRMDIIRYINDAPSTSGFPLESPGRAGVWLGWQIVRKYMKKFPETTLQQLMDNTDYQQILNDSEYFPE